MTGWPSLLILALILGAGLLGLRSGGGFRRWTRPDKINYVVMVAAAYPWLALTAFTHPPAWYTWTAATASIAATAVFITRSLVELRRFDRERTTLEQQLRDQLGPPPQ